MGSNILTSIIWQISTNELQILFDNSATFVDILKYFNLSAYNGNHRTLKRRIIKDNIDLCKFNKNKKIWLIAHGEKLALLNRIDDSNIFIEKSNSCNHIIKDKILKNNLMPYICTSCDNTGQWQNKRLSLQLDHINGINNDHRLENLRFLCPNCHSQTETFSGKAKRNKRIYLCNNCGNLITKYSKNKLCKLCTSISLRKVSLRPSKEELLKLLETKSYCAVGRDYAVSDNTIRKWLK